MKERNLKKMQATYEKVELGKGIYTISDVAYVLKMKKSKVRYWINSYLREKLPEITSHRYNMNPEHGIFINFSSLLELYIFEQLELKGHSRKKILECYEAISINYDTKYPFTKRKIVSAGGSILFEHKGKLINADKTLQLNMSEVLAQYLEKIEFNIEGKAIKFFPQGKQSSIVLDPEIQFGTPIVNGTRINVSTVVDSYNSGDSIQLISLVYGITSQQVEDAIEFEKAA